MAGLACCHGKQDPAPRFEATVGQLEEAQEFLTFIDHHAGEKVVLDVQISGESFQGSENSFDLWEDCDKLEEGQTPSALAGCTGFEFVMPARLLVKDGALWRLRGTFRVEPAGGPLQGLMIVKLNPVGR